MVVMDVAFPDVHDFRLVSLHWDGDNKSLTLLFRADDEQVDVRLEGVTRLRVASLLEGNIVDEALVLVTAPTEGTGPGIDPSNWIEHLVLGHDVPATPHSTLNDLVRNISLSIELGKKFLLVITSSFGCEAWVLFSCGQWISNKKGIRTSGQWAERGESR